MVEKLADIAPTLLELMGLNKPNEMTGAFTNVLITLYKNN